MAPGPIHRARKHFLAKFPVQEDDAVRATAEQRPARTFHWPPCKASPSPSSARTTGEGAQVALAGLRQGSCGLQAEARSSFLIIIQPSCGCGSRSS